MSGHLSPEQLRLIKIFMPLAFERQLAAQSLKLKFVHYTSAEGAMGILRSREFRLRQVTCMNDFMEVQHGLDCLVAAVNKLKSALQANLDAIHKGLWAEVAQLFDGWAPHFKMNTYLACVSEHLDSENTLGRLSMWRAYGAATGIALVMNSEPFFGDSGALAAYASPVAYLDAAGFEPEFAKVVDNIGREKDFLRALDPGSLQNLLFRTLMFAAVSTKHPGFQEEREWRVVHIPDIEKSKHLLPDIQLINGVPQPIYRLPLKTYEGGPAIAIPELVDRLIIGPSQYPWALYSAFVNLLAEVGVKEAHNKVFVSAIPLRR